MNKTQVYIIHGIVFIFLGILFMNLIIYFWPEVQKQDGFVIFGVVISAYICIVSIVAGSVIIFVYYLDWLNKKYN
jgi:hypothetical protein